MEISGKELKKIKDGTLTFLRQSKEGTISVDNLKIFIKEIEGINGVSKNVNIFVIKASLYLLLIIAKDSVKNNKSLFNNYIDLVGTKNVNDIDKDILLIYLAMQEINIEEGEGFSDWFLEKEDKEFVKNLHEKGTLKKVASIFGLLFDGLKIGRNLKIAQNFGFKNERDQNVLEISRSELRSKIKRFFISAKNRKINLSKERSEQIKQTILSYNAEERANIISHNKRLFFILVGLLVVVPTLALSYDADIYTLVSSIVLTLFLMAHASKQCRIYSTGTFNVKDFFTIEFLFCNHPIVDTKHTK